ncbi:hypothetical protein TIFTF001_000606 [Ficus carica]|uniref:Uncharacterized protein n=1 Tax=Ficus carica TaxID=3494 RepID=A0AA87YWB6_FICCA|nr:hypothetical protein TIFTF001_000606 [Ficus carica]
MPSLDAGAEAVVGKFALGASTMAALTMAGIASTTPNDSTRHL